MMNPYHVRTVTVWITDAGIEVGVYGWDGIMQSHCRRISGTTFQAWPAVFKLLQRIEREGLHATVRINADTSEGATVDGCIVP
jgi:hypothetical protein